MRIVLALLFLVACAAPTVTPRQIYTYYLPMGGAPKNFALKGVALVGSCADAQVVGALWQYNWSPTPAQCLGMENVPMVGRNVPAQVGGNSRMLLTINEPDLADQADMTPEEAVLVYAQIEVNFPTKLLALPVQSQLHPDWLPRFYTAYVARYNRPPRFDIIAVHCYFWTAAECIALLQRNEEWAIQWSASEIWLTEFGFGTCNTRSLQDVGVEITQLVEWIRHNAMVTRYAYFTLYDWTNNPCQSRGLLGPTGIPTLLGELYKGF